MKTFHPENFRKFHEKIRGGVFRSHNYHRKCLLGTFSAKLQGRTPVNSCSELKNSEKLMYNCDGGAIPLTKHNLTINSTLHHKFTKLRIKYNLSV